MDGRGPGDEGLEGLLRRYDRILEQIEALERDKRALREQIQEAMGEAASPRAEVELGGRTLRATIRRSEQVVYDEELLRERLGDRYRLVLAPDPRRIRAHLDEVAPLLEPVLELCGKPSPERVRAAIEGGTLRREEFRGAFERRERTSLTIRRLAPRDDPPEVDAPDAPY